MRVVIAGGGTGGHIVPGLTIARALLERYPDADVSFAGTRRGLEADLVPRAGFTLHTITVRSLRRKLSVQVVGTLFSAGRGLAEAVLLLRRLRPNVVVGTGGYVAGPVLMAAVFLRIPTLIQEQNAYAGMTNRILGRWVHRVALGYPEARAYFSHRDKLVVTGNPLRPDIKGYTRSRGAAAIGLRADLPTLLVGGGSQGARSINRAMVDALPLLQKERHLQILHQTGPTDFAEVARAVAGEGIEANAHGHISRGNVHVVPFIHDMPAALAAADLVVGRAGAMSIAEFMACGLPAILVPLPTAAEGHQEHNAVALERAGAAVTLQDKDLSGQRLAAVILELIRAPERLAKMKAASRGLATPEANGRIVDLLVELASPKGR